MIDATSPVLGGVKPESASQNCTQARLGIIAFEFTELKTVPPIVRRVHNQSVERLALRIANEDLRCLTVMFAEEQLDHQISA